MDKKRDIENAELLANEQDIKDLIATLKKQLTQQQQAEARKLQQQNNCPAAGLGTLLTKYTPQPKRTTSPRF
ncbi:MAG: hypothetical protein COA91_07545 [Robiginitomaculum sp.]|nr:MAG: hypothetical protein COA91_07545 [Robiginitomaculum sp.]